MEGVETMSYLFGLTLASLVGALFIVRIFEYLFSWMQVGALVGAVKLVVFVSTWTAITAGSWTRGYSARVRQLRRNVSRVSGGLNALSKTTLGRR
jgi:hypothetical protein